MAEQRNDAALALALAPALTLAKEREFTQKLDFGSKAMRTCCPRVETIKMAKIQLPALERFSAALYRLWQQEIGVLDSWNQLDESEKEHFRVISERILSLKPEFDEALQENVNMVRAANR